MIRVVDRPAWVRANIVSFQRLLAPLLERWEERTSRRSGLAGELTSRVAAVELGTLLGWMSSRVLGQYDLLLAGRTDAAEDRRRGASRSAQTAQTATSSTWSART